MTLPVGLRVVSFNIEHGNGGDPGALGRACAGLDADVLALQEVDVRVPRSRMVHQVGVVARATGMHAVFGRTCRVGAVGRYGNALFSRAPMTDVACLTLPRLGRNEVRGVIVARVAGVTVATTHLSIHQDERALQLDLVLATLAPRPRPWVLLGDLNRLPDQLESVTAAGLTLVDASAPTFPVHAPDRRIDHIAVAGLAVESVEVLPQQEVGEGSGKLSHGGRTLVGVQGAARGSEPEDGPRPRRARANAVFWLGAVLLLLACSGGIYLGPLAVRAPGGWNLAVAVCAGALLLRTQR